MTAIAERPNGDEGGEVQCSFERYLTKRCFVAKAFLTTAADNENHSLILVGGTQQDVTMTTVHRQHARWRQTHPPRSHRKEPASPYTR